MYFPQKFSPLLYLALILQLWVELSYNFIINKKIKKWETNKQIKQTELS